MFLLVLGMSYLTCAIVVFIRDLQQIIAIALQIGMWATPILWDISMLTDNMKTVFKLNPLVYTDIEALSMGKLGFGSIFILLPISGYLLSACFVLQR